MTRQQWPANRNELAALYLALSAAFRHTTASYSAALALVVMPHLVMKNSAPCFTDVEYLLSIAYRS